MKKMYFLLCLLLGLSGAVYAQNQERKITTWNGYQWSKGIPDGGSDAVITADLITTDDLQAYNLTIDTNVKLTISGSSRLILFNDCIAESGAKIVIEEAAQFIQKNPNALTPSMDYPRKTAFILKYDYTYFCSPVSGQVINAIVDSGFNGGDLTNGYVNTNGPGGTYLPPRFDKYWTWNQAGTPVGTDSNIYSAGAWQNITDTSVMASTAKGYIVRAPDSFPDGMPSGPPQQWRVKFSGVPNSGTITPTINGSAYTPVTGAQTVLPTPVTFPYEPCNNGLYNMNLIGNPYPSALDADTFLAHPSNQTAIDGAIYMWSHNSGPSPANPGNGTQVSNYTANDYVIYNLIGGIGTGRYTGDAVYAPNGFNRPTGKIGMCQGFFVRGLTNGPATFIPDMQDTGIATDDQQFYRLANNETLPNETEMILPATKNRFWLSLEGGPTGTTLYKETLVGYMTSRTATVNSVTYNIPASTNGYEKMYDTEVIKTVYNTAGEVNSRIDFYTMLGATNACPRLAIQGRNIQFRLNDVVPLGFSCPAGNYTIRAEGLEGLFTTQPVFLREDIGGGFVFHNLPHLFTAPDTADNTTRFQIVFTLPNIGVVNAQWCNTTLNAFNTTFNVTGGTTTPMGFNWLFTDATGAPLPGTVAWNPVNTAGINFTMTNAGIPFQFADFGMTYFIKVGYYNTILDAWVYSENPCSITTPQRVITAALRNCGSVINRNEQVVASNNAPFQYSWRVTRVAPALPPVTFTTPTRTFLWRADSLGPLELQAPGFIMNGAQYNIQVAILYQPSPPIEGAFSGDCFFTMPVIRPVNNDPNFDYKEIDMNATAYPNPFQNAYSIAIETENQEAVEIEVYDMIGKMLEHVSIPPSEVESFSFGEQYSTGVYNVIVTQGNIRKNLKVIKK